jgi:hypothetical protein
MQVTKTRIPIQKNPKGKAKVLTVPLYILGVPNLGAPVVKARATNLGIPKLVCGAGQSNELPSRNHGIANFTVGTATVQGGLLAETATEASTINTEEGVLLPLGSDAVIHQAFARCHTC